MIPQFFCHFLYTKTQAFSLPWPPRLYLELTVTKVALLKRCTLPIIWASNTIPFQRGASAFNFLNMKQIKILLTEGRQKSWCIYWILWYSFFFSIISGERKLEFEPCDFFRLLSSSSIILLHHSLLFLIVCWLKSELVYTCLLPFLNLLLKFYIVVILILALKS